MATSLLTETSQTEFPTSSPPQLPPPSTTAFVSAIPFACPTREKLANATSSVATATSIFDSSLTKSWNLGHWAKLKVAAEAYNISNSIRFDPSLNGLVGGAGNTTVGTYSVALSTYRRMQFGVRVDF
ncbi:MAG: hypothetical protein ABSF28_16705 [Terracidiphilus sp.]